MSTLKGIWVFNDTLSTPSWTSQSVNFTSESTDFTSMSYEYSSKGECYAILYKGSSTSTAYEFPSSWASGVEKKTIDFGSTEQTVDDTFYTWLTANATPQANDDTSAVTVEYDGAIVVTIPNGNKATLPIKDKQMKTDLVVTVPSGGGSADSALPIEVSTEAEMTALLESGEVGGVYKYTGTTGTYENGALYVLEEGVSLISFTIDGTSYEAEDGMTWEEWVESDHNTGGYWLGYNDKVHSSDSDGGSHSKCVALNDIFVRNTDTIQAVAYLIKSSGGTSN